VKQATTFTSMVSRKISPYVWPGIDMTPKDVPFANFLSSVAGTLSLTSGQILSPSREQLLVEVRQCMWYVLYHEEKKNYSRIARMYNRDHATVLYGVKKVNNLLGIGDRQIQKRLETILFIYKNIQHYGQEATND